MSQRSPASGHASGSPKDGPRPAPLAAEATAVPSHDPPRSRREDQPMSGTEPQMAAPYPPSQMSLNEVTGALIPRPPRSLDVHNILNPTPAQPAGSQTQSQRRPEARSESTAPGTVQVVPTQSPLSRPTRTGIPDPTPWPPVAEGQAGPLGHLNRPMLTPRSPSMRAASMGRASLSGPIGGQRSPFINSIGQSLSGDRRFSQGSEHQPLPTPPAVHRLSGPGYGFPPFAQTPPPPPPAGARRQSVGTTQGPQSQSASPTTSYSSYGQPSHTSPGPPYGPSSTGQPASSTYYASASQALTVQPGISQATSTEVGPYRGPGTPLAPSNYQLLTLDTDQGPIQVPVDVRAASKMADDKRKRNAGASARFRQRRKEKEKEASQTIAKLEQQIRDITEEREFYRQERDHFRRIVAADPGQAHLMQRPPSPTHEHPEERRAGPLSPIAWSGPGPYEPAAAEGRRRPSAYQAGPLALPPSAAPGTTPYGTMVPAPPQQYYNEPPRPMRLALPDAPGAGPALASGPGADSAPGTGPSHGPGHGPGQGPGQRQGPGPGPGQAPLQHPEGYPNYPPPRPDQGWYPGRGQR